MAQCETVVITGPCILDFKAVEVGETEGDITLSWVEEVQYAYNNKYGRQAVDGLNVSGPIGVDCAMTAPTWTQLAAVANGTTVQGGTTKGVVVGNPTGARLSDVAGVLIIKPVAEGGIAGTCEDEWVTLYSAAPRMNATAVYSKDGTQRLWGVHFDALPDSDGCRLLIGPEPVA